MVERVSLLWRCQSNGVAVKKWEIASYDTVETWPTKAKVGVADAVTTKQQGEGKETGLVKNDRYAKAKRNERKGWRSEEEWRGLGEGKGKGRGLTSDAGCWDDGRRMPKSGCCRCETAGCLAKPAYLSCRRQPRGEMTIEGQGRHFTGPQVARKKGRSRRSEMIQSTRWNGQRTSPQTQRLSFNFRAMNGIVSSGHGWHAISQRFCQHSPPSICGPLSSLSDATAEKGRT